MAPPKKPMTTTDASRIQSTQAKAGNDVGKGSFPARSQSAAQNNVNKGAGGTGGTPKAATGKPASGAGNKKK